MEVHEIINIRSYCQDVDNVISEMQGVKKPKESFYILVSIVVKAKELQVKESLIPTHYCHECSHSFGEEVRHKDSYPLQDFLNTALVQKYKDSLAELQSVIY